MNKKLFLIAFLGLFISCTGTQEIFNDFDKEFVSNRWYKTTVKTFTFDNSDYDGTVDVKLHFSHVYDYQYNDIPIEIQIISPKGYSQFIPINLIIKDENGKDVGNCTGDVCDLFYTVKSDFDLIKGKYTVHVKNAHTGEYLPNVLGLGITFETSK